MAVPDVLELSLAGLEDWCEARGEPRYRAAQVAVWLYRHGARDFAAMRNLPPALRAALAAELRVGSLAVARARRSADGTRKLLLRLPDGAAVESVLIPDGRRLTLCVSTQVGCAMGCGFCATATLGFRRHLTRGQIVEQLLLARALLAEEAAGEEAARITNVVFMGMGEPLHNYPGTVGAVETLTAPWGLAISPRRVTVSTVGLVPEMARLLAETTVNLAVSLTTVDEDLRRALMPVSRRYSVAELLAACRALPLPRRKRVTFEVVLLAGVNDAPAQARALARALHGIRCKVNLIPFNPFPGSAYARSDDVAVARFQDALRAAGVHATVRESRGTDIAAACGQLVAEEGRAATPPADVAAVAEERRDAPSAARSP
jgi:23S rRNA (adenine2503-C2)-methyltransferase